MKKFLAALALAVFPVAALAADMSYTYVDAQYAFSSQSTFTERGAPAVSDPILHSDGFIIGGSFGFMDNFHVVAEYSIQSGDLAFQDRTVPATPVNFVAPDVDLTTTMIGVGYHNSVGDNVDGFVNLGFASYELSQAAASTDESGIQVEFGFRAMAESVGVDMSFRYADLPNEFGDRYSAKLGGSYSFTDMIALTVGFRSGNDQAATVGVRVSF